MWHSRCSIRGKGDAVQALLTIKERNSPPHEGGKRNGQATPVWHKKPPLARQALYIMIGGEKGETPMSKNQNEKSVNVVAVEGREAVEQACQVMAAYESLSREEQQAVVSDPALWGEFEIFVKAGIDAVPGLDKAEVEERAAMLKAKLFAPKTAPTNTVRGRLQAAVREGTYHSEKRMSASEKAFYEALLATDKQELADAHAKNKCGPHADSLMQKATNGKRAGLSGAKPHLQKLVGVSLRDMYARLAE